jgi:hypothetical protein
MTVSFKRIAKSLTGFSTPIFGVSWNPPKDEREVIRKMIIFLEDRRVLFNPYRLEHFDPVIDSVLKIRKNLTEVLENLGENSEAVPSIRAMRAECRKFLDYISEQEHRFMLTDLYVGLGELRGVFGQHIARLCTMYGIDVEGDLVKILPIEDKESSEKES